MRALMLNCSLKPPEEQSNTQLLADHVIRALDDRGVTTEVVRLSGEDIPPGVETDLGEGDAWPGVHERILAADIVVFATPTWLGQPSSLAKRALERMDAMLSETDDEERPVAYNKVAGVVVTGNEDGAHHVISEICGALVDLGFTVPGQSWTYWNRGPGPGPSYADTDEGHDWSHKTGRAMAANLHGVASALAERPLGAPPA